MVVQHNLMSMNANRMLGMTSKAQSKTSEKLSSGYKINRAADDAAGLAISEKMRKQIKGLDRSSTNAQDGISSVQTAEGALSEVHSMLQRMNELAVQAANGTNSEDDRNAIQSEIELLSQEIDRVSESTKFNETFLLKGSSGTKRHYLVGHDAGLKGRLSDGVKTAEFEISTYWPGDTVRIGNMDYTIGSSKKDAADLINKVASDLTNSADYAVKASAQKDIYVQKYVDYAKRAQGFFNNSSSATQASNYALAAEYTDKGNHMEACANEYKALATSYGVLEERCKGAIQEKALKIGNKTYVPKYDKNFTPAVAWEQSPSDGARYSQDEFLNLVLPVPSSVTVEYVTGVKPTDGNATIKDARDDANTLGALAEAARYAAWEDPTTGYEKANDYTVSGQYPGNVTNPDRTWTIDHSAEYTEMAQQYEKIEELYKSLIEDNEIIIGEGTWNAKYTSGGNPAVTWTEYFSGRTTGDLVATTTPVPTNRVNGYRVLYEAVRLDIMTDNQFQGEGNGVDDNDPSLITKDKAYEYTKRELLAANNIGATAQTAEIDIKVEEKDRRVRFLIDKGYAEVNSDLNFALHVGADADLSNKIMVNIEAMSVAGLGIENINLADNSGLAATYAIDAITDAILKVSTQRSNLGAIQNRLEQTINNLDNVTENTTAAESRIRDTDMAEAMVEHSKNNILAQAGQSMLAQANQSTQGVLSLLQ